MFGAIADFISMQQGDSVGFIRKAQALAIGIAKVREPTRLYVIRIDNWFGPKWLGFAGTFTAGKYASIGVHKPRLHVPPFIPSRVLDQRAIVGPNFEATVSASPLHIDCPSKEALSRRIDDIDKDAAFLWFSGESEAQKRGSVMVYLPVAFDGTAQRRAGLRDRGAFYVGFSQHDDIWEPAMLRGISLGEVEHFNESGRALAESEPPAPVPCT